MAFDSVEAGRIFRKRVSDFGQFQCLLASFVWKSFYRSHLEINPYSANRVLMFHLLWDDFLFLLIAERIMEWHFLSIIINDN